MADNFGAIITNLHLWNAQTYDHHPGVISGVFQHEKANFTISKNRDVYHVTYIQEGEQFGAKIINLYLWNVQTYDRHPGVNFGVLEHEKANFTTTKSVCLPSLKTPGPAASHPSRCRRSLV